MSRLRRMSRARPNWSASIQRRLLEPTLPRAKLQKSHAALHALVTATLQSAGPPRVIRRSMSQVLEAKLVTVKEPVLGKHRQNRSEERQGLDSAAAGKDGVEN